MRNNRYDGLDFLDFGLSAFASGLAVFALGMSLGVPAIGYLFMVLILFGTAISAFIHRSGKPSIRSISGFVYTVVAILAFAFRFQLNAILPEGGVPEQLIMAGVLGWMLTLGSFALWKDSSIIFQAVPTIALFGLVGAFDTFAAAPFTFFGFLLCFAILFARAHGRLMMEQADDSGSYEAIGNQNEMLGSLKAGPWRWMAGPEWALASALAIVLMSLLGAPVIQRSVQGVAGVVRPNFFPANRPAQPTLEQRQDPFRSSATMTTVGNGALKLKHKSVFRCSLEQPEYLRSRTYDRYTGRGWAIAPDWRSRDEYFEAIQDENSLFMRTLKGGIQGRTVNYFVIFDQMGDDGLPIPGVPSILGDGRTLSLRRDLTVKIDSPDRRFNLPVRINTIPEVLTSVGKGLDPIYSNEGGQMDVPVRVADFAKKAVAGAKTDWEKANLLKRAIEDQVEYDLGAPAVPLGSDPVEYFLFQSRRGYCDLFASSMVMLARSQGMPARYVTGYYPGGKERDQRGNLVVLESDAHAWAEIYFENAGWVPFDPTEGAPNRGQATDSDNPFESPAAISVYVFLLGILVTVGPYWLFKHLKERRSGDPEQKRLAGAYSTFVRALEKRSGRVKRPSQTPQEFVALVMPSLGEAAEPASRLNQQFIESFYSNKGNGGETLAAQAREFRRLFGKRVK